MLLLSIGSVASTNFIVEVWCFVALIQQLSALALLTVYFLLPNACSDGSVENDLPMQQLSELFNVNHFIVSQVRHSQCCVLLVVCCALCV